MTPLQRTRSRWLRLRREEAQRIIASRACLFCKAPIGVPCQKNPPYGKVAPFPHVARRS